MVTIAQPTMKQVIRQASADAIGTFALVFAGCGAIVVDTMNGGLGHLAVCLVFGLVVGSMIFAVGHISGAHFNPAVTLAFAAIGTFSWKAVPVYITAQLLSAIFASYLISLLIGDVSVAGTYFEMGFGQAFMIEVILTFFLMFVITAVATDGRAAGQFAGLAIGAVVALCALIGGPLTGASMNPARSIGPALIGGQTEQIVLYVIAPIVGALLGAFTYRLVACDPTSKEPKGCC